jgi:hypothetical protein
MVTRGAYKIPTIFPLPPELRRRQKIRVSDAAKLNAMHEDTFRARYSHLIRSLGGRIQVVELGDALDLPEAE